MVIFNKPNEKLTGLMNKFAGNPKYLAVFFIAVLILLIPLKTPEARGGSFFHDDLMEFLEDLTTRVNPPVVSLESGNSILSYYDENKQMHMQGNVSVEKKSVNFNDDELAVYEIAFADPYEEDMRHAVFGNRLKDIQGRNLDIYDGFILTEITEDTIPEIFYDNLYFSFARNKNIIQRAVKPVILYIDGEFEGLFSMTVMAGEAFHERMSGMDMDYLSAVYFNSGGEVYKLTDESESFKSLSEMKRFLSDNDFSSDEVYNEFYENYLDIRSFADYYILYSYSGKIPGFMERTGMVRPSGETGKWHFAVSGSPVLRGADHSGFVYSENERMVFDPDYIFEKLMENDAFEEEMQKRAIIASNSTFRSNLLSGEISRFVRNLDNFTDDFTGGITKRTMKLSGMHEVRLDEFFRLKRNEFISIKNIFPDPPGIISIELSGFYKLENAYAYFGSENVSIGGGDRDIELFAFRGSSVILADESETAIGFLTYQDGRFSYSRGQVKELDTSSGNIKVILITFSPSEFIFSPEGAILFLLSGVLIILITAAYIHKRKKRKNKW